LLLLNFNGAITANALNRAVYFFLCLSWSKQKVPKKKPHGAGFELMDRTLPPKNAVTTAPFPWREDSFVFQAELCISWPRALSVAIPGSSHLIYLLANSNVVRTIIPAFRVFRPL
jgi:hypothetical protein